MKKNDLTFLINPFIKIAGYQALGWGVSGLCVSTLLSYLTGYHYHGLLHYGPAPNNAFWCYAVEHIVIWLVPALLFYIGSILLSRSHIRLVDMLGTIVFAQLPLIIMNLLQFLPPMQQLAKIDMNMTPEEMLKQPDFLLGVWLSLIGFVFVIWMLVWMFNALRVSSNLKGYKLGILYCIGVFGGDILCRYLIHFCYV